MAKEYCIPKPTADILIAAIKEGDVVGNIGELYSMTTQERRAAFSKHVGDATAKQINTEFEKAMISNQKTALKRWAEKTFNAQAKKEGRLKTALDKINELDEQGLLTPENTDAFLSDLVEEKLGATISAQEAQKISELSRNIEKMSKEPPSEYGPSLAFFKAKREMDNYLDSLTPTPKLRVATSVIGRGTMLFSLKSPLVNIESNTVNAISESLARRIETGQRAGIPKNGKVRGYMKYANEVFLKTGYDVTRMITFNDGKKRLGEDVIHSQGPGKTRRIGRFYTDVVFNKLMTAPDVAFAAFHFSDAANIYATAIAKSEGLSGAALKKRVSEIFVDSVQIEPQTEVGQQVRQKARLEAERGTYTNKNNYSEVALMVRKVLNSASGDMRIGDQLMPFVQVPATVVGVTVDYSGVLLPIDTLTRVKRALNARKEGDADAFKAQFDSTFFRKVTRAGIGLTTAMILSSWFDPEDFIGEYPTTQKERELLELEGARENSIRVGNKWISMDYFGPLAAPFIGMMTARKYGNGVVDSALRYVKGAAVQATRIPGFSELSDVTGITEVLDPRKGDGEELKDKALKWVVDFVRSRTIPAIVSDLAKGTDPLVREVDKYDVIGRALMAIPGLRNTLPPAINVFGEPIYGEGFFGSVLFGSRVGTRRESQLVDELTRLNSVGQLPSITDVRKTSSRAKELKAQIGEQKFQEFYVEFGQRFKAEAERIINHPRYKASTDDERKEKFEEIKSEQFEKMLKKYGYKKPKPVSQADMKEGAVANNIVTDVLGEVGGVVAKMNIFNPPAALAAEEIEDWNGFKEEEPGIFKRFLNGVNNFIKGLFDGETYVYEKPKDAPFPYRLSNTPDGKVKIEYPNGQTEVVAEKDKAAYMSLLQQNFKQITGQDYPDYAPNWTGDEQKAEVARVASAKAPEKKAPTVYGDSGTNRIVYAREKAAANTTVTDTIKKWADHYGVPRDLALDIAFSESGFSPDIQNPAGSAKGVYQYIDKTWNWLKDIGVVAPGAKKEDYEANIKTSMWAISKGYLSWWDESRHKGHKWGQYYTDEELKRFYIGQ